ncbi:SRPBCC domain-containing protein [Amycolatopsis sp. NBC_00355]|uniref:SRPBCC family protein n=1 Tax=Amycolatopsis sp. NBC_00355 TaxID=2975957 RepID=UPI002E25577E
MSEMETMETVETPHELVLTDTFPVSRDEVWAAWTDPARFATWWVGPGFRTHDLVMEVEPRGRFAAKQSSEAGDFTMPFAGFYVDVVPGERLVLGLSDEPSPDEPMRTEMTVTLTEVDGGTRQEFRQTGVVTDEHFAALEAGTRVFFSQLGAQLAGRS